MWKSTKHLLIEAQYLNKRQAIGVKRIKAVRESIPKEPKR